MHSVLTIFKICAELLCNLIHFYLLECVILTNKMFLGSWCPGRINSCWKQRVHIKVRCLNISPFFLKTVSLQYFVVFKLVWISLSFCTTVCFDMKFIGLNPGVGIFGKVWVLPGIDPYTRLLKSHPILESLSLKFIGLLRVVFSSQGVITTQSNRMKFRLGVAIFQKYLKSSTLSLLLN